MDDDTLVFFGGEVKALGDGKVGGFLIVHSTHADPDLQGDFFNAKTDYGPHRQTPILYDHGFDTKVRARTIGMGALDVQDAGVWLEGQLNLRDEYEKSIYQMVEAGKLGWSSGTASHLVEREARGKSYHVKTWPLGLDASLTPTPAEPRTSAVPLKSLASARELKQADGPPDKIRAFEKLLREVAGYSREEAETIALRGFKAFLQREVGDDAAEVIRRLQLNHLQREADLRNALVGG